MLKNYFLFALRRLQRNVRYASINTFSLAIGICSCILIGLYIQYETGYDRFHTDSDRIARITMEYAIGGVTNEVALSATKAGPQFSRTFPGVTDYVRTWKGTEVVKHGSDTREEDNVLYADSSLFTVFTFPLIKGNPETALNSTDKVVLTESAARRYFGNEDPVDKVLQIGSTAKSYRVSGVAEDPPPNSQIRFDFVLPFHARYGGEEWFPANYITYLRLHDGRQMGEVSQKIDTYMREVSANELEITGGDYLTYQLEPLEEVHLHSSLDGFEPNGSISSVYILGSIALLIMLIACINYTNLATAQATRRTGEIGIRKALGARKGQLFGQMLGESAFLTFTAMLLATGSAYLLLPLLNSLTGAQIAFASLWQPIPLAALLLLFVVVSLCSGAYPAFILSNFKLVDILKSKVRLTASGGFGRQSLIVFQFAISIFLIIATIIISQQLSFIQSKDLGYDKEHVLVLPVDRTMRPQYDALKDAMALNPGVTGVSGAYETPTYIQWGDAISVEQQGGNKELSVNAIPVDMDFLHTMDIAIVAGSDFTEADYQRPDSAMNVFMLNEAAVAALGWTPQEAVGEIIDKNGRGEIKAVVRDFHFSSLHQSIGPLMIFPDKGLVNEMLVKLSGDDLPATLDRLENTWNQRVTHRPFEYHFLDEEYDDMYRAEQRMGQVVGAFSAIAVLLACLGLFALSAFTTVQRTKEIGIRKVLGASVASITALLSTEFVRLVLVAMVIAMPLAWYGLREWLTDFAYRIDLPVWAFGVAGVLAVILAIIAVSFQTVRAAMSDPVKALKSE
ncbi:ABC transporter permease [Roseivirga sp. BDSF3-8]|uniref:ABC transporter permease n=1 Tax=Roseivirga sp. BDSF3-8 TaxID=3241598 RepID=UPI0035323B6D